MSEKIALDFGSARTLLAEVSGRILLDEPTAAAVDLRDGSLVCFGTEATEATGRSAGEVGLVRPVVHGQLQDLELTDHITEHLLNKVHGRVGRHPEVICTIPGLATGVQKRAMERSLKKAGAAKVQFIEHAMAAGIGFRLSLAEPVAAMVVDVGAGTTDVAVMALGGVVTKASIPVGGDAVDRAVRELLLRSFDLVVSLSVAEQVKREVVTTWPGNEEKIEVSGRDAVSGLVRSVVVSSSEAFSATAEQVESMLAAATGCIVTAPPDLANDLLARGLYLAGSGGLLKGFARSLATATGIPVHLAERPGHMAVLGAARCLGQEGRRGARVMSQAGAE